MASKIEKIENRINEFNLNFVAIYLVVFMFCFGIFPIVWHMLIISGNMLPSLCIFFSTIFNAVAKHPLIYLIGCNLYYLVSLKFFRKEVNTLINFGLLILFAIAMLFLSGPYLEGGLNDPSP